MSRPPKITKLFLDQIKLLSDPPLSILIKHFNPQINSQYVRCSKWASGPAAPTNQSHTLPTKTDIIWYDLRCYKEKNMQLELPETFGERWWRRYSKRL